MSRIRKFGLAALGALGASVAVSNVGQAQTVSIDFRAEEACQQALEAGTIEALEEFLFRYPDAPRECRVLALSQLSAFSPNPTTPDPNRPEISANAAQGGYGG